MKTQTSDASTANAEDGRQFLTFTIESEEYGIDILKVQEIKGFSRITPIPNSPMYVKGVLNLRGAVVPVVDLRVRFGMREKGYDQFTVIIVVNVGDKVVGLVVDAVSDVLNFGDNDVEPAPEFGTNVDGSFISGMAKAGDRLITLLDVRKLLDAETLVAA